MAENTQRNLTEIAEVIEVNPDEVRVRVLTTEGCETCSMKESCALSSGKDWMLTLNSDSEVKVGDMVKIEIESMNYLAAGALVFILPLVLMTLAYFFGQIFLNSHFAVFIAFIGLAIGIAVAYLIGHGKGADKFRYRIVKVLPTKADAHNN